MSTMYQLVFAAIIIAASVGVHADNSSTEIDGCPKNFSKVSVKDVKLKISSVDNCPLLEDKELRKLVEKFGHGSVFVYPATIYIPDSNNPIPTCVSGEVLTSGTLGGHDVIGGYSESALRQTPEATALGNPFLIDGTTFLSLAAMTVVSFEVDNISEVENTSLNRTDYTLFLDDRLTLDLRSYPFIDTEEFNVVGTGGPYAAVGRMNGTAKIYSFPPIIIEEAILTVNGTICIK